MRWTGGTVGSAALDTLNGRLGRHRGIVRVLVASLALTLIAVLSRQQITEAGPALPARAQTTVALPANIGVGLQSDRPVTVRFERPMDADSVAAALVIEPATDVELVWLDGGTTLQLTPADRWMTDRRYVISFSGDLRDVNGEAADAAEVSFTTQTAPSVRRFEIVAVDGGEEAAVPDGDRVYTADSPAPTPMAGVSVRTAITVHFSGPMDRQDVEERFVIEPAVAGAFAWDGDAVSFTPDGALDPGVQYTVTLVGAADAIGNRIGHDAVFTFTTQESAQVVRVRPNAGETGVTDNRVSIWFSEPVDTAAVVEAFGLWDVQFAAKQVPGEISWDADGTQLTFVADNELARGHLHHIRLGDGARDIDGNPLSGQWPFTAQPAAAAPEPEPQQGGSESSPAAPPAPAYAPGTPLAGYALQQINSARAAYGFAPLALDPAASAAASAHAWDQLRNGYYSHTSLDGRNVKARLSAAGASFGMAGENQCHHYGLPAIDVINWCHGVFMAEPYPGFWNHIGNILNPRWTRVGVGVAEGGGRVVITWDFVD